MPELLNTTPTLVFSDLIDFVDGNNHGSRGNCSFSELLFPNLTSSSAVESLFNFCFLTIPPPLFVRVLLSFLPIDGLLIIQLLSLILLLFSFADVLSTLLVLIGGVVIVVLEYLKNKV